MTVSKASLIFTLSYRRSLASVAREYVSPHLMNTSRKISSLLYTPSPAGKLHLNAQPAPFQSSHVSPWLLTPYAYARHVAGKASEGGRWKNGGTGTMLVVTFHIMPGEQADSV